MGVDCEGVDCECGCCVLTVRVLTVRVLTAVGLQVEPVSGIEKEMYFAILLDRYCTGLSTHSVFL